MIYQSFIVTDQSYEVSCHDKNFDLCPMRFSCPAQGDRENKSVRESRRVTMFAVAGYHAVVCDAFIKLYMYIIFSIDFRNLVLF